MMELYGRGSGGVNATEHRPNRSIRSSDRQNPLELHRVTVREVAKNRLRIGPIEAIDGTPVIDIKLVLSSPSLLQHPY
jgi:tRNA (Thr-GGU) A37 N-methylase